MSKSASSIGYIAFDREWKRQYLGRTNIESKHRKLTKILVRLNFRGYVGEVEQGYKKSYSYFVANSKICQDPYFRLSTLKTLTGPLLPIVNS